jgi:UDPglucose--hexose-1-phosphate uridylyltransferase
MPDAPFNAAPRAIRFDPITGAAVVVAPARSQRPHLTRPPEDDAPPTTGKSDVEEAPEESGPVPGCPFCPGYEDALEVILDERPPLDRASGAPWQTRVVANKFPALVPSPVRPEDVGDAARLFLQAPAEGRQEVVIDTPRHHAHLADLSPTEVEAVLTTYAARYRALRAEGLVPFVFRNHGAEAGASIAHPHSQVIATRHVPADVRAEEGRLRNHYDATGRCLVCDLAAAEAGGPRVVLETADVLAVVPFAATVPMEVLFVPRAHVPDLLAEGGEATHPALARALTRVLRRLRRAAGDVPYNLVVRTPLGAQEAAAPHLHGYLRLLPRTTVTAGFEIGTGLHTNPSSPEADAARLRVA